MVMTGLVRWDDWVQAVEILGSTNQAHQCAPGIEKPDPGARKIKKENGHTLSDREADNASSPIVVTLSTLWLLENRRPPNLVPKARCFSIFHIKHFKTFQKLLRTYFVPQNHFNQPKLLKKIKLYSKSIFIFSLGSSFTYCFKINNYYQ